MLHGLEAPDHGLDARPYLVVALRECRPLRGQRFLALPKRAVLFPESVDGHEEFFDAAFELREFGTEVSDEALRAMQGRLCDPREVASAALFLASDDASFVNGAHLFVDNAYTAA